MAVDRPAPDPPRPPRPTGAPSGRRVAARSGRDDRGSAAPRFALDAEPAGPLDVRVARSPPHPVDAAGLAVLSAGERERARSFRRPEDAARFVTGRVVVRRLLAERLGTGPAAVDLVVPRPGWKPRVPGTTLDVSIAHAADVVLVAIADGAEIGVDVEGGPGAAGRLDEGLWRGATSPAERAAVGPLDWPGDGPTPATVDAFLRVWARKEALLKALRLGLAVPMGDLTLRDGPPPEVLATADGLPDPDELALIDLDAPPGLRAALAARTRRAVDVRDATTGERLGAAPASTAA